MQNNKCCFGCEKRNAECHVSCEPYNAWKSKHVQEKKEIEKIKTMDRSHGDYIRHAAKNLKNRQATNGIIKSRKK